MPPMEYERKFIASLEELVARRNSAALAALRRGLGKKGGEVIEMHRYVARWLSPTAPRWDQDMFYLIASLFAYHPLSWKSAEEGQWRTNLGASLALLRSNANENSLDRRFSALLKSHRDDLYSHLPPVVSLLRKANVPIDWPLLLHDVRAWDHESGYVQRQWAMAFWGRRRQRSGEGSPDQAEVDSTVS